MSLLAHFPEKKAIIVEHLLRRLETEQENDAFGKVVAFEIIFNYVYLNPSLLDQFKYRFVKILRESTTQYYRETISVQSNAACYLIYLLENNIESRLVKMLTNTMKLPGAYALYLPMTEDCVDAFLLLEEPRCINALTDILDDQTQLDMIFETAGILLGIYFGAEDYKRVYTRISPIDSTLVSITIETEITPLISPLNDLQKKVIRHLIDKAELWQVEIKLFEHFGLPVTQHDLQNLII